MRKTMNHLPTDWMKSQHKILLQSVTEKKKKTNWGRQNCLESRPKQIILLCCLKEQVSADFYMSQNLQVYFQQGQLQQQSEKMICDILNNNKNNVCTFSLECFWFTKRLLFTKLPNFSFKIWLNFCYLQLQFKVEILKL